MAAPLRRWVFSQTPAILSRFATTKEKLGQQTLYRVKVDRLFSPCAPKQSITRFIPLVNSLFLRKYRGDSLTNRSQQSTTTSRRNLSDSGGDDDGRKDRRPLKLMDFKELIWPSPIKSIRNAFFSFLIRAYFDEDFSSKGFLDGAQQGVHMVSGLISRGNFSELDGLVTREAQREIKHNYNQLSASQQLYLAVEPADIFFRFIHEIGIILDDKTNERFVEITAVFQGIHGYADSMSNNPDQMPKVSQEKVYVCNYRLVREYTKGKEDDWIINKLNHFKVKELVDRSDLFQR